MKSKLPLKLLKLRKHYNLSQAFVASQLDISVIEYMGIENGREMCNINQLAILSKLYAISLDEMIRNDDNVTLHDFKEDYENKQDLTATIMMPVIDDNNHEEFNADDGQTMVIDRKDFVKVEEKTEATKKKINYGLIIGVVVACLFIGTLIYSLMNNQEEQYLSLVSTNEGRLAASDRFVVYISDTGKVYGQGDNTNGQLNTNNFSGVVKVQSGVNYTVILKKQGTVDAVGLNNDVHEELLKWDNIIDIASGKAHIVGVKNDGTVVCVGDNSEGQCNVDKYKDIKKAYAHNYSTVLITNNNETKYIGENSYSNYLNDIKNVKDVAISDDFIGILKNDGTVECIGTSHFKGCNSEKLNNIVQISAGNGFLVALDNNGQVYIDIDNTLIEKEVSTWTNIIAIATGRDYIVGFDGDTIYGAGNNTYNQFSEFEEIIETHKLNRPKNLAVNVTSKNVLFTWDNVNNADYYNFEINTDPIFSVNVDKPTISMDGSKFEHGKDYVINIKAMSKNEEYDDSDSISVNYTYFAMEEIPTPTPTATSEVIVVPIKYTIAKIIGENRTKVENYLYKLGAVNIQAVEDENVICDSSDIKVLSITGISEGEQITEEELKKRSISYTYCKYVPITTPEPTITPDVEITPTPLETISPQTTVTPTIGQTEVN